MTNKFKTKIRVDGIMTTVNITYRLNSMDLVTDIDIVTRDGVEIDYETAEEENSDIIDEIINHIEAQHDGDDI